MTVQSPCSPLEAQAVRCVLVHSADGSDEVGVAAKRGLHVEGLLEAQLCKSAEVRDVVLIRDGVHVGEEYDLVDFELGATARNCQV
jgi:hypothetical protein